MRHLAEVATILLLLAGCSDESGKRAKWPPRTGRNDREAAAIPPDATLSAGYPRDAPLRVRGSSVLGSTGAFLPSPGDFRVESGAYVTDVGGIEKRATFRDWCFVYKNATKSEKVGWGVRLTEGEMLIPLDFFQKAPKGMYVENLYAAEDFGDKNILIRLDPARGHSVCILDRERGGHFPTVGFVGTRIELDGVIIERREDGWYQGDAKISD